LAIASKVVHPFSAVTDQSRFYQIGHKIEELPFDNYRIKALFMRLNFQFFGK